MAGLTAAEIVGLVLVGTGTAATVYSSVQQGKAIDRAAKEQSRQETMDARSREIARKRRLLATLSSRNASAAAGGVDPLSGSTANLSQRDISTERLEGATDRASTRGTQDALRARGSNARRASLVGSVATTANTGAQVTETYF